MYIKLVDAEVHAPHSLLLTDPVCQRLESWYSQMVSTIVQTVALFSSDRQNSLW